MSIHVHLLPQLFEPAELEGGVAVMIDVLRASSTICTALNNGASGVRPFADVEATRDYAAKHSCLMGGERGGVPIDGFDFGNSPSSYSRETVSGREICFTTTNGTLALTQMERADEILIGCFLNRAALAERLAAEGRAVHLVCAGTDGAMTAEDVLFAGAIAADLNATGATNEDSLGPHLGTELAVALYRQHASSSAELKAAVRSGQGGRNLTRLGLAVDIDKVMQQSSLDLVPRLVDGVIVA